MTTDSPANAMKPPTAMAPFVPMLRAPDAVPRIVFTNPAVSTISIANAFPLVMPAPGSVAPRAPTVPSMARRKTAAGRIAAQRTVGVDDPNALRIE